MNILSRLLIIFVLIFHATNTVHPQLKKSDARFMSGLEFDPDTIKPFESVKPRTAKKKNISLITLFHVEHLAELFTTHSFIQSYFYLHFVSKFTLSDNTARAPPVLS